MLKQKTSSYFSMWSHERDKPWNKSFPAGHVTSVSVYRDTTNITSTVFSDDSSWENRWFTSILQTALQTDFITQDFCLVFQYIYLNQDAFTGYAHSLLSLVSWKMSQNEMSLCFKQEQIYWGQKNFPLNSFFFFILFFYA